VDVPAVEELVQSSEIATVHIYPIEIIYRQKKNRGYRFEGPNNNCSTSGQPILPG